MKHANATRAATSPALPNNNPASAQVFACAHLPADCLPGPCIAMAQPDELAVIVAYLRGEMQHAFYRLVQKLMVACHG